VQIFARKTLLQNVRIFKQADTLQRAGHDVSVIGVQAPGSAARETLRGATIARVSVPSFGHSGALFALRWLAYYVGAYRLATRGLAPPDVVHCNDLDSLPVGLLVARRHRVPVVYDVQDLFAEQDHIPGWLGRLLQAMERALIGRVQRICAVNDAIAEVIARSYGVRVDAVVLNCPPLSSSPNGGKPSPDLRATLRLGDSQTMIVYSGTLGPHRGLGNLIGSLRHLDEDAVLVMLGEGELRGELERVAADEGVRGRVFFRDFVPHLEVPGLLAGADVGVVPYEHIGMNNYLSSPSKLFHYIMAGLPVACSDFPFLRSVVVQNEIGAVFDPADPASIAAAIRAALALRGEALDARLEALRRRYCWEQEEQRFLGVYHSLTPHRVEEADRWRQR
jgi:glycosyltransferase involved in cell wall biosynthesis